MKYIKYGFVIALMLVSFYASDRLLLYVESLSPIMKSIESNLPSDILPVNAVIDGNTIIPGKNGEVVNKRESYLKMNDFGAFNETFYVYDYVKPRVSLYDNLDKIIVRGFSKTDVSLIVDNKEFENYLLENNIKFSKIISKSEEIENKNIEYINGGLNSSEAKSLDVYFKRNKINKKLCIIGYSSNSYCSENKYFKIEPTIDIYKSNLASEKGKIDGGSIIFIHNNLNISEAKLILNEITANNLNIIYLSDLISE